MSRPTTRASKSLPAQTPHPVASEGGALTGRPGAASGGLRSFDRGADPFLRRAVVVASLPNAMVQLETADGKCLLAHVSGNFRMKVTRLLPGDEVVVKCSPLDPGRARVCDLVTIAPSGRSTASPSVRAVQGVAPAR